MPVTAVESQISKATTMTLQRPMLAPVDSTRRAAFDPVFDLIAAHKKIVGTIDVIEAEHSRLFELNMLVSDDEITEPASIEIGLFFELLEIVPTTVASVVALVTYLDEVNKKDPWKFEDNHATPLIGNLAEAFNRIAAAS
jgi:hypothetical protein